MHASKVSYLSGQRGSVTFGGLCGDRFVNIHPDFHRDLEQPTMRETKVTRQHSARELEDIYGKFEVKDY